ncbi:MAG: Holliday junction resolvase RuvX [Alphaproteobacteria bacterium]|jgi:putative Holliday junction resolvase|nr:Holliday junction resolvase RuvX [Alphaproteobacteria bacterium]MBP9776562.1 Holliday junction resolvase RuvX [Alphaproteobacteria bacterium]
MPLLAFEEFSFLSFGKEERLLGCDVGQKTIGLALSDTTLKIATAFQVIHRTQWKKDSATLLKIILTYHIGGIVVGFPLNMNGSEGPRCQSTRQFVTNLITLQDLPICLWDERLSTLAVTRTLLEADLSRAKRSQVIDKVAASYILQGALDARGNIQK